MTLLMPNFDLDESGALVGFGTHRWLLVGVLTLVDGPPAVLRKGKGERYLET